MVKSRAGGTTGGLFTNGLWLGTLVGLACALSPAQAASAPAGLVARLSVAAPVITGLSDVPVTVSITNTSRSAVSVLRWQLPSNQHDRALFRITRNGQAVAYTGRLVKRGAPTAADYLRIEPGSTVAFVAELSADYDLSGSGTYAIEYLGAGSADAAAQVQRADPLYIWLESRPATSSRLVAPAADAVAGPVISYTGNCSASQQTALAQAVADATQYANGAVNYFASSRYATARYIKWFGLGTRRDHWNTGKTHFLAIQNAFATQPLVLDCSCTDGGTYAYVYPNQPYKIYACGAFWSAPALGTDSKAGTLIHEMSHFTVVAGTDDWVYGQAGAAALAISDPVKALNNADNHEYFAENTPALP